MELYLIAIVATMWLLHSIYNWSVDDIKKCKKLLWETGVPLRVNFIRVTNSGKIIKINFTNLTEKEVTEVSVKFVGLNDELKVEEMILTFDLSKNNLKDFSIKPYFNKTISFEVNNPNIREINQHYPIEIGFEDGTKWLKNK